MPGEPLPPSHPLPLHPAPLPSPPHPAPPYPAPPGSGGALGPHRTHGEASLPFGAPPPPPCLSMLRCRLRTLCLYPPQPRPPHALLCSARPSFPGSTTHDARPADRHAPRTAPRPAHAPEPRAPPPSWGLRAPWRRGRWGPRCCAWAAPWSAPSCSRRPTGTARSWRRGRPPREGPRPGPRTRTRSSRRAVSGTWARLARLASSDGRGAQRLPSPGRPRTIQCWGSGALLGDLFRMQLRTTQQGTGRAGIAGAS